MSRPGDPVPHSVKLQKQIGKRTFRANLEERSKVCAHGIENQCQDLKAAVECNAVSHCVNTEWRQPKVDDDICDVCKKFIGQIADMLKDKTVQQPDVVCAALGLCKHRAQIRAQETLSKATPTLSDFPLNNTSWKQYQDSLRKGRFTCDFCLLVVKKLKQSLRKERTEVGYCFWIKQGARVLEILYPKGKAVNSGMSL
ncbi:hypothetical protein scyTo_0021927 [Scyliorhinus torazame]|uniref:Saposin A-type domain-containing protein n=1 Tax=Scyliorhinus torazame TaxID=75743 RepID=A0A401Q9F3_SCYTO|nr:hypothetical protein [Scyliorhinus torazame]